jgi:hypothetical protein
MKTMITIKIPFQDFIDMAREEVKKINPNIEIDKHALIIERNHEGPGIICEYPDYIEFKIGS